MATTLKYIGLFLLCLVSPMTAISFMVIDDDDDDDDMDL